jgi:type II secretory pathway pseudopilin PulG
MRRRNSSAGFSLIELLVILAMVGLVLAIALPLWLRRREAERRASCAVKLTHAAKALQLYHDNYNQLPALAFYRDARDLDQKNIALKGVMPGNPGKNDADLTTAPYSMFVKLLPYYEAKHFFEQINFRTDNAFAPDNFQWAARVLPYHICPSFGGQTTSTAVDYHPPAGMGRPALTNYKAVGATTLACLQDSASVMDNQLNGGILHPYAKYSFSTLPAPTMTVILAETKEQKYAAWWDGTTASIPGFHPGTGNVKDDRLPSPPVARPALNISISGTQQAFITAGQFGGREDIEWGPSSDHPGIVNHAMADTEIRAISDDIDPVVYSAIISRRATDNGELPGCHGK